VQSARFSTPGKRLRPSGGNRALHSFPVTTLIYDGTVSFCDHFVDKRSRLVDQMTQAARSGRQNIAEGSRASATSSHTELRLINVARASLDELLLDHEDSLRHHGLPQWTKDSPAALAVRRVGQQLAKRDPSNRTDQSEIAALYRPWLAHQDPTVVASALICLIHQANYLLDQQVRALEKEFVTKGGYTEHLAAARLAHRAVKDQPATSAPSASVPSPPACPVCGGLMVLRTAKKGPCAGNQFWGCAKYPACKGTKPV